MKICFLETVSFLRKSVMEVKFKKVINRYFEVVGEQIAEAAGLI